jgi:hypothetical protein
MVTWHHGGANAKQCTTSTHVGEQEKEKKIYDQMKKSKPIDYFVNFTL